MLISPIFQSRGILGWLYQTLLIFYESDRKGFLEINKIKNTDNERRKEEKERHATWLELFMI